MQQNKFTELSADSKRRYSRNIMLEEIGKEGQLKLLNSKVLVVGSGALGSIAALYLSGSGIGTIGIADFDTVDISNLQRQVAFTESDTGKKKVLTTAERMRKMNSDIDVIAIDAFLTPKNISSIINDYDLVIEGSDNPSTKYMVADECERQGKRYCLAGVSQFSGQVMSWQPGETGYRQLFPEAAEEGDYLPCSIGGVCGPLTGIVGSTQAVEAIKMLLNIGSPLYSRLLMIDALTMNYRIINLK